MRKYTGPSWETICVVRDGPSCSPPGGALSRNPKFGWATKHSRETGHEVLIRKTEEWVVHATVS